MCTSADDRPNPIGGSRSYHDPSDQLLRDLGAVVRRAVDDGAAPSVVLSRVVDGLTGQTGGYVERAAASLMTAAFDAVVAAGADRVRDGASFAVIEDQPFTTEFLTKLTNLFRHRCGRPGEHDRHTWAEHAGPPGDRRPGREFTCVGRHLTLADAIAEVRA